MAKMDDEVRKRLIVWLRELAAEARRIYSGDDGEKIAEFFERRAAYVESHPAAGDE